MLRETCMRMFWSGTVLLVAVAGCRTDEPRGEALRENRQGEAPAQQPQRGAQTPPESAARQAPPGEVEVGGVLSCRPEAEVEAAMTRLIALADANQDGALSKDEALGLTNVVVGGFFFRADENGDGVVTPEEGRKVRAEFMNQNPAAAALFQEARRTTGKSPFATLARLFDVDYGKPLPIAEARDAARAAVEDLYRAADQNRDGILSRAEASAVVWDGARALGRSAFEAADGDRNGRLTLQEFQAALQEPAKVAFAMADTNNDGQLTEEEGARAMGQLVKRLGIQPPAPK
ncbi:MULTISPECIES: EF-hand domain-containing protein [Sorangium]|uniref:EF-hand domain-containing protein n=1 Tax=Sorangium cellulosum TaxID=56 RepID=A0A4P2QGV3_SORCE|nr:MULTISPECIES: EF-hand domain-containing protein [Sorangium]AUX29045.1 uncharacterized protein SOCE836_011300 [Sorangium cellulosum]WCQ88435.1 hypothetical protein NQZ70_01112 [Sorangium sp. Soce836]